MTKEKNREYWRKRFEQLEQTQHQKSVEYYKELEKAYIQVMGAIEKDILKWYNRFAENNEISLDKAKQLLKSDELKEFKWTVDDYIKYGEENAINQQWMKELENVSARVHISRLESLRLQLQQHIETLYGGQIEGFEGFIKESYQNQYYHTIFEIQKAFKVGFAVQVLNDDVLTKVISKPWTADGLTFSARIWRDRNLLINTLHTELTQAIARGEGPERIIKVIQKKMNTSRANAARLVQTEQAFFSSSAQKEAFKELGVELYEIVSTLDSRTSKICQGMDGKVFKMSDYEPGVTAPPFHPRCRTTTCPYFDDMDSERFARGVDGKTYYVPSNMKYREWNQKQVEQYGENKIKVEKLMNENINQDKEQFKKYKLIFGDELGVKNFKEFQKLKYNDVNKWNDFKQRKQSVLNTLDYRDSFFGIFGDKEVREWYIAHDKTIIKQLNPKDSLEDRARMAHSLRNKYRTEARLMMKNREEAERLNREKPNLTFEELIKHKIRDKHLEGDEVYKDIISSAEKTNEKVNKKFGLEG